MALEWLAKFNNEYHKGFLRKGDPEALHNTDELYKATTDAQNARRRDIIHAIQSGKLGPHVCVVQMDDVTHVLEKHMNRDRDLRHEEHFVELVGKKIRLDPTK